VSADVEAIRRAYEADRQQVRPVTHAGQVPSTYEAITPEWLTAILCRDLPDARVTGFRLDERDDGSSNRRRIFVEYNEAGQAAGLPPRLFCKAAEGLENRIVLGVSDTAQAEADFYNLARGRLDIQATRAVFAGFDPETFAYIIVMPDMADAVHFCDERTRLDWDGAVSLVTTLAKLHGAFFESPELGSATLPFKHWPRWWRDMMKGAPDFPAFCDRGFHDAESVIPPRLYARAAEIWPATERSVTRHLDLPRSLIHSDVHFKNWYRTNDGGELGLSDWQLATVGHWSRDYAFATTTALTVEQRREWGEELLRTYLDRLAAAGGERPGYDDALTNVRQQLLSALAFWTITLRPTDDMPAMQPERTTFEFIRRMATAIDDLDSLSAFGGGL